MKKKREFKMAADLSIKDTVYQIKGKSMLEHLDLRNKATSLNSIQYYALDGAKIKSLHLDENEENLIVNGKLPLPIKGTLGEPGIKDILTDEAQGVILVLGQLAKQQRKARDFIALTEDILDGLAQNVKIYEDKAKDLNLSVTVKDFESGEILSSTDDELIEEEEDDS